MPFCQISLFYGYIYPFRTIELLIRAYLKINFDFSVPRVLPMLRLDLNADLWLCSLIYLQGTEQPIKRASVVGSIPDWASLWNKPVIRIKELQNVTVNTSLWDLAGSPERILHFFTCVLWTPLSAFWEERKAGSSIHRRILRIYLILWLLM